LEKASWTHRAGSKRLRKRYNNELHDLKNKSNNIWACKPSVRTGCVPCKGRMRNVYKTLVTKPAGKRSPGRNTL